MRYEAVGSCIYCGGLASSGQKLSTEHIIPMGLGGSDTLPEASCESCEKITSRFERVCLQQMFKEARAHFKIPAKRKRRPEGRPTKLPAGFGAGHKKKWIDVPIDNHPFIFGLPKFGLAGQLHGKKPDDQIEVLGSSIKPGSRDVMSRFRRIGSTGSFQIWALHEFCLLLEKIAHGYACAELRTDNFAPLLPDVILGRSLYSFQFVGGGLAADFGEEGALHRVQLAKLAALDGSEYLGAYVQLFAGKSAPIYHVVVGTLTAQQSASELIEEKVGNVISVAY